MRTYCLLIRLKKAQEIEIGKLGSFEFPHGFYIYTGSALNKPKRIERHFSKIKKKRWHIDYLLEKADVVKVFLSEEKECEVNKRIFQIPNASIIARKFGSTDCKCKSHLAYFTGSSTKNLEEFLTKKLR